MSAAGGMRITEHDLVPCCTSLFLEAIRTVHADAPMHLSPDIYRDIYSRVTAAAMILLRQVSPPPPPNSFEIRVRGGGGGVLDPPPPSPPPPGDAELLSKTLPLRRAAARLPSGGHCRVQERGGGVSTGPRADGLRRRQGGGALRNRGPAFLMLVAHDPHAFHSRVLCALRNTKTRSGPKGVRMSGGERPVGAAKGKQSDTEALCQAPSPRNTFNNTARAGGWYDAFGALWSAAGGANWMIATYCPSLGPFPSAGGGAHGPLTAPCPSSPSLAYLSLSTSLSLALGRKNEILQK